MKKTATQAIKDAVQKEKRSGQFSNTLEIWDAIPPVLNAIQINDGYVKGLLDFYNGDEPNAALAILNKILRFLGLQAVKKDGIEITGLDSDGETTHKIDELLCVDERKLAKAIDTLAKALSQNEEQIKKAQETRKKENNESIERIKALEDEKSRMMADYRYLQSAALKNVQELCSENQENDNIMKWAESFLSELNMRLLWSNANGNEQNGTYFTTLKTSIAKLELPCILKNDDVLLKGLVYEKVEE